MHFVQVLTLSTRLSALTFSMGRLAGPRAAGDVAPALGAPPAAAGKAEAVVGEGADDDEDGGGEAVHVPAGAAAAAACRSGVMASAQCWLYFQARHARHTSLALLLMIVLMGAIQSKPIASWSTILPPHGRYFCCKHLM